MSIADGVRRGSVWVGCGCGLVHLRQLLGGMNNVAGTARGHDPNHMIVVLGHADANHAKRAPETVSHGALSSTTTTTTTAVVVVVVVLPLALGVVATSLRLLLWRARIISHSLEEDARYIWNEGSMVSRDK